MSCTCRIDVYWGYCSLLINWRWRNQEHKRSDGKIQKVILRFRTGVCWYSIWRDQVVGRLHLLWIHRQVVANLQQNWRRKEVRLRPFLQEARGYLWHHLGLRYGRVCERYLRAHCFYPIRNNNHCRLRFSMDGCHDRAHVLHHVWLLQPLAAYAFLKLVL